jgi:peptidoglycan hydrolase CwlO-like protein
MSIRYRTPALAIALALVAVALASRALPLGPGTARADPPSLSTLNSQLSQQQAHQHSLSASIAGLDSLISSLDGQISLVQSREADVHAALLVDQAKLAASQSALARQQAQVKLLRGRLALAQHILAGQLVSNYEESQPDIVSVVLSAHGFTQLLEQLNFLGRAEQQQQSLIVITKAAKYRADTAAARLLRLEASQQQITDATAVQVRALAGMNELLSSRQSALARARGAQQDALAASRERGAQLQSAISKVQAEQAAAAQAAEQSSYATAGPALGPSGGWAIPYAIVLCESGGQDLPPNSAGASGYYQILPSTWKLFGGTGPAAYLAPKSEQDAVAARIWNGGAGASNWVCAGIVGIH